MTYQMISNGLVFFKFYIQCPSLSLFQPAGVSIEKLPVCLEQSFNEVSRQSRRWFASGSELMRPGPKVQAAPSHGHIAQVSFSQKESSLFLTTKATLLLTHPSKNSKQLTIALTGKQLLNLCVLFPFLKNVFNVRIDLFLNGFTFYTVHCFVTCSFISIPLSAYA